MYSCIDECRVVYLARRYLYLAPAASEAHSCVLIESRVSIISHIYVDLVRIFSFPAINLKDTVCVFYYELTSYVHTTTVLVHVL